MEKYKKLKSDKKVEKLFKMYDYKKQNDTIFVQGILDELEKKQLIDGSPHRLSIEGEIFYKKLKEDKYRIDQKFLYEYMKNQTLDYFMEEDQDYARSLNQIVDFIVKYMDGYVA